jgi:translocation and assembly module TamA
MQPHFDFSGKLLVATISLLFLLWVGPPQTVLAAESVKVKVLIKGISDDLLENVRAFLSLEKPPSPLTETTLRQLYKNSENEIKQALQAFGYYHPVIQSELMRTPTEPTEESPEWEARFEIDPGPRVFIKSVDIDIEGEGKEDKAFLDMVAGFSLHPGSPLLHEHYDSAKNSLQNLATERGYFNAKFTKHRLEVDTAANQASIVLHFETGPRYKMGPVRFEPGPFDPDFLKLFVRFQPGVPYHNSYLLAMNKSLSESGYFSNIEIRMLREEAKDREIPIYVKVAPRKKYQFSVGFGYGTDTGPRGLLGWEDRLINSKGHRFTTELDVSVLRQTLTADYAIPLQRPATDALHFRAGLKHEETVTSDSRLATLGINRTRQRGSWLENLFLNYRWEVFQIGSEHGRSHLLLPGVSWTYISADNRVYPRFGKRITLLIQGTDPVLGSDTRLLQGEVGGKLILPVGPKGRLLLRTQGGGLTTRDFDKIPASIRYFTGGDQTVRGYSYNSLGPRDATGEVVGGHYLLIGSAEIDHRIGEKLGAAVFYDIGNAFDNINERFNQSVGIGARWYSPVGPIRVDLAYALTATAVVFRVHINMGPDL